MTIAPGIYEKLTNEEDARLCRDIDEAACRESPHNFLRLLASYFLTKLGDAVASPKTTLAWLIGAVGAPAWLLGLLVPIRESGSLIPQLFIGALVRRLAVRKWVWVAGSLVQALCVAGLGVVAIGLSGPEAAFAILLLVVVFSLARGFCSVASKDVLGKTIPKRLRGQLTGWSASAAGLVTIGVGAALMLPSLRTGNTLLIGMLLLGAAALWLVAAVVFSSVAEYAGETDGGRGAGESLRKLRLLISDRPFGLFVATRALLMCSALSAPFYVALAQARHGLSAGVLSAFIVAAGLAALVSAPVWGRFADRSSKYVMITAATLTAAVGIVTFVVVAYCPGLAASGWLLPTAYFVLSVAHAGVRVGRKTYIVDLATGNKRTDYVAISNSVIGVLLLAVGAIGALTPVIGSQGIILVLAIMGLAGAALGTRLPQTQ